MFLISGIFLHRSWSLAFLRKLYEEKNMELVFINDCSLEKEI